MRVLFINSVCGIGSTGRICTDLAQKYEKEGHTVKIAYGRDSYVPEQFRKYAVRIGTDIDVRLHVLKTRLFDGHGFGSKKATKKFLSWLDDYAPDMIWLHNIHGYYINIELLFAWIKQHPHIEVKWTLHDCWTFTGHCSHFITSGCEQWKTGCVRCIRKRSYPSSWFFSRCDYNYNMKKALFTGVNKMTIYTPCKWLAGLVKQSYLAEYPIEVVYNTIDNNIFSRTKSNFRQKHHLDEKIIVLGVASIWSKSKGLFDFIELAQKIDNRYSIVMVGLNDEQLKMLPPQIIGIKRTNDAKELAEIYSSADIFFNPTHADTYPTVNLEAQACGTYVITYDVGGAAETIHPNMGVAIPVGELDAAVCAIKEYCEKIKEK